MRTAIAIANGIGIGIGIATSSVPQLHGREVPL